MLTHSYPLVVVKIHEYKPTGSYQGPEQIWLLPDGQNFKIIRRSLSDWGGPIEYIVKLSELLPQTVQQNSPMKGTQIIFIRLRLVLSINTIRWSNLSSVPH